MSARTAKIVTLWPMYIGLAVAASMMQAQQAVKPHKHAMPMPGMQMGHENHNPASDLRTTLTDAWNSADAGKCADLFGDSAVIILPQGNLITGQQSVREFLQSQLASRVHLALTSIGFESSPDLEVDFGVLEESRPIAQHATKNRSHDRENDSVLEGKYLIVLRRTGPDWKIQQMVFVVPGNVFTR